MTTFWCELAWLGGEEPRAGVVIEENDGLIGSVTAGVSAPPPGAERLDGLVIPGLANAHSHAFQRALRGRTEGATGTFWTWREQMYALAERLTDADVVRRLARATFGEMALAGITLVGEFDYLHHSEAMIDAAREAGIRMTLLDACYLEGGLPSFRDASAEAWIERVSAVPAGEGVRTGAAIHSVRAVDPDSAATVARFAAERGWVLHAHVSEQVRENEECLARHGVTPTGVLGAAGALSERFTAVHGTHLTDDDAAALREAGAFVCMCPTTERDLADGIGTAPGRVTLGSDSQSVIDLFEEARAVELDERLATGVRGRRSARELLTAATANGYESLGWPGGGVIAPRAPADLVATRRGGVRLAGVPAREAVSALVFAGTAADVSEVIVGGRFAVREGQHVDIDVPAELQAVLEEAAP
jgi:formiminoglutamate deiminase